MTVPTTEKAPEQQSKPDADTKDTKDAFTQADVDKIVRERIQRERAKFADYDDLKAKAEGAKTAEQRLADMEARLRAADEREARASLVGRIAREYKITDPDDIALFLTGADEETLTAQAQRLSKRDEATKKAGPVVPRSGTTPAQGSDNADLREFTRKLFNKE